MTSSNTHGLIIFFAILSAEEVAVAMKPTNKLHQAVDVVRRYMEHMNYALYDGSIYNKPSHSKYTYVFASDVHAFVHHILGNAEVADAIITYVTPIINLLSQKTCQLIKPIKIDYNFIEVLPRGTCFNIRKKCFELDPEELDGKLSSYLVRCQYLIICLETV